MRRALASELAEIPGAASYRPVYREHAVNLCPGCARTQWYIGRYSAECACCGTSLPLQEGSVRRGYPRAEKPAFFTRDGGKAGRFRRIAPSRRSRTSDGR